jgi:hypothetical protein
MPPEWIKRQPRHKMLFLHFAAWFFITSEASNKAMPIMTTQSKEIRTAYGRRKLAAIFY